MLPAAGSPSLFGALKNGILEWMFQWRGPERGTIVLVQRRVFILPTRQGLLFAGVIVLMLIGSVNYDLSLGFILAFLLGATGIQSMLHTFRNLANLRISPGRVQPVFAGEQVQFQIRIANQARLHRYSIGITSDKKSAVYIEVPPDEEVTATVAIPAIRRGWQRPGRLTLFTFFPAGLFRAWSYADLDMHALVYPAPAAPGLAMPVAEAGSGDGGVRGQGHDEFSGLRPYRPGDSPRHIAWKAVARDDTLLTKQFSGRADAELWLAWETLPPAMDGEMRIAHLTRWVIEADRAGLPYGLRLPGLTLPIAAGAAQRSDCLRALALHGLAADRA
ncbi:MAG: DUF58 domain-containing protein [Burkholderiales bacterium]|nr:DUF58 domain-containing protein [Burkholderiales bacterium]